MKRWAIAAAAFMLAVIAPARGMDIGKLSPVETIWVAEENGSIWIRTDCGEKGQGRTAEEAFKNLKDSSAKTVFLETADYLIVETGKESLLTQLFPLLRASCMVCAMEEMPDLEKAAVYLSSHEPSVTLGQWRIDRCDIPQLRWEDGRFQWIGFHEDSAMPGC